MKRFRFLFPSWLALILGLTAVTLRAADETPAAATPPDDKSAVAPAEPPAAPAEPAATVEPTAPAAVADETEKAAESSAALVKEGEGGLREIGADGDTVTTAKSGKKRTRSYSAGTRKDGDVPFGSHHLSAGNRSGELVSVFGSSTVDGESGGDAVSIFGNTTVNGSVRGAAVSVMGTTTVGADGFVDGESVAVMGDNVINGHVKGEAVVVMGDMKLGPDALVEGDIVVVGGRLVREAGAQIKGDIEEISIPIFHGFGWLHAYLRKCVLWGRLLWFGEVLGWAWLVAGGFLVFYLLLALVFPRGIDRCAETLEKRPGGSILAALLTAMLTPVLIVILAMTGIGIALIPVVGGATLVGTLFGKAVVLAWFGRRVLGAPAETRTQHTLLTVLVGGLIMCLIYCVPIMGMLLYKLFGVLGLGVVVLAVAQAMKREKPASRPPFAPGSAPAPTAPVAPSATAAAPVAGVAAVVPPAMPEASAGAVPPVTLGVVAPSISSAAEPPPAAAAMPAAAAPAPAAAAPLPPVMMAATLPRAGFWIRLGAEFLDFILIAILSAFLSHTLFRFDGPGFMFFALAVYSAIMWKTKGTTIGGIICGLKVVRIDDRPIDWSIAIVRALSAFLSFFAAGLGFIWVVFDEDKQSWHDKIAGTTIVRVPKGTPLL